MPRCRDGIRTRLRLRHPSTPCVPQTISHGTGRSFLGPLDSEDLFVVGVGDAVQSVLYRFEIVGGVALQGRLVVVVQTLDGDDSAVNVEHARHRYGAIKVGAVVGSSDDGFCVGCAFRCVDPFLSEAGPAFRYGASADSEPVLHGGVRSGNGTRLVQLFPFGSLKDAADPYLPVGSVSIFVHSVVKFVKQFDDGVVCESLS